MTAKVIVMHECVSVQWTGGGFFALLIEGLYGDRFKPTTVCKVAQKTLESLWSTQTQALIDSSLIHPLLSSGTKFHFIQI